MRIHHLNCISVCPTGGGLVDGRSGLALRGRLSLHCLLVETERGLVLVDTGLGLRDVADPASRLSSFFLMLLRPELREEMTAVRQIEALGFSARDVRHIVLTHLDFDHAGGLDDFPAATVHMLAAEDVSAKEQATILDRVRYRPQQWSSRPRWLAYPMVGERWFGFDAVTGGLGLPPEILLVPLIGHTLGHAGVAVHDGSRWLLAAGDAYLYREEMSPRPHCTPGLRAYQWLMEKNRSARLDNQRRLRELKAAHDDITIFCGHDPVEFEALAGRPLGSPIAHAVPTWEREHLEPVAVWMN